MSYTKFSKEIRKWMKDKGIPAERKSNETPEEREKALAVWEEGTKYVFNEWLDEKRYKELISCAHGGWYKESEFFEPLADFFVKEKELHCLQVLCERKIRFEIEDMLKLIKYEKDEGVNITPAIVLGFDIDGYNLEKSYKPVGEIVKYRIKALDRLENYIRYLEKINADPEYLEIVITIKDKVFDLSIKKSDLKSIKNKF